MGRATVVALADAGAHVVAVARRENRLLTLKQEIQSRGGSVVTSLADVTQADQIERTIAGALQKSDRIDLLVYATGTNAPDRALPVLTRERWDELLATNLTGAFQCTQAVLPAMRRQKGGLIIYIASACVQFPDVSGVAYQASKHGLVGLAHGTRVEEKQNGIRTSVIFPGLCDTEILTRRPVPTPRDVLDQSLAPEDVASAVLFLANLPSRAVVPELQLLPARL